jgi:periplasmic copper chaperone A
MTKSRGSVALGAATVVALVLAAGASAHAIVSPAVAKAKVLQQFTLAVPTEKEDARTTKIELTVPSGFAIDSFEPAQAPWKQQVQATGSGEEAVVTKVTWSGGSVPTGEDAVFRFNASTAKAKTYLFDVRQTYSDGSIVNWSTPSQSSDTPAPRVEGRRS